MDAKALKSSLKTAVENIKLKKYVETVKICKDILAAHPQHSRALVFLGKAAEGLNKTQIALESYQKATEYAEDGDMLPWQGLCAFYEKHAPKDPTLLSDVYTKLIELYSSNKQKELETKYKLCKHLLNQATYTKEVAAKCFELCSQLSDEFEQSEVRKGLAELCMKSEVTEAKVMLHELCLLLSQTSSFPDDELDLWETHTKYIYEKEEHLQLVLQWTDKMLTAYPHCSTFSVIVAEIHCQLSVCGSFDSQLVDLATVKLNLLTSQLLNFFNRFLPGAPFTDSIYPEKLSPQLQCCGFLFQARKLFEMKSFKQVPAVLEKALLALNHVPRCLSTCVSTYKQQMDDLKLLLNFKQKKYQEVINVCNDEGNAELVKRHCRMLSISYIEVGNFTKAESMLGEDKALQGYMELKQDSLGEAFNLFTAALVESPKSVEVNLWLGQVCYLTPERLSEAAKYLLTAAKLDPTNEESFLFLGLYYNKIGDKTKGLKCIKKAYSLNAADDKICLAYVDELMALGYNNEAKEILVRTTQLASVEHCKWAWFRLGNLMIQDGNFTEAANCFQQALRSDSKDSNCWECLADSYVKRGSYAPAILAFTEALKINPNSFYSKYSIALSKYKLGLNSESLEQYLEVLSMKPGYIPALKGLGDVHLAVAREALNQCIYGKAVSNINSAVSYLTEAAVGRPNLSCIWKSLGDALNLTFHLPPNSRYKCPQLLTDITGSSKDLTSVEVDGRTALAIASRCYSQCSHLNPNHSQSWHDLAVNYLSQAKLLSEDQKEKKRSMLLSAVQFCLKALSLDRGIAEYYNLLGVLYLQPDIFDALAAQHYLILAVELDQKNAVGWTNLGSLYLKQDKVTLAHKAFSAAQSADPKYVECWVGQAMVAQIIGDNEAMDLFRHATDLGHNIEGRLSYAQWVLRTLIENKGDNSEYFKYSIEKLEAVPTSCYALGNIIDMVPVAQAFDTYGLLLERLGLYKMAAKALTDCVQIADDDCPNMVHYRSNLARVLCKTGDYNSCLDQLKLQAHQSEYDVSVAALACYKKRAYSESWEKYKELLEMVKSDEMKSHVYAALGMLSVKCGDAEAAKTFFFQCSQYDAASTQGLAAFCSLALLTGEGELAVAALTELLRCPDDADTVRLKCMFSSYMEALKGELFVSRNHLLKGIHSNPLDLALHSQLLTLSVEHMPESSESVLRLCDSVNSVQMLAAVARLSSGHVTSALRLIQKATHTYPGDSSNWVLLLCVVRAARSAANVGHMTDSTVFSLLAVSNMHRTDMKESLLEWLNSFTR